MIDLSGKKGLVVGIANDSSIAWGCAKSFHKAGADLAITYLNEKAEPHVRPLAEQANASIIMPLNVKKDEQMEAVFKRIEEEWGQLDFLLHAIAYAPLEDLHGRVTDCSREGFMEAMDISCHSFIRMAKLAEPLMKNGGSLMTVTYAGSQLVVNNYGLMGPAKAALESATRYLASELGEKKVRVNALSPGPMPTRAASGIADFHEYLERQKEKSPLRSLLDLDDIGNYAAFLASDLAKNISGSVHPIDAGYNAMD